MNQSKVIAIVMYAVVIVFLIVSGLNPHDRFTWLLEVSWVIIGLIILAVMHIKAKAISWYLGVALFLHALVLIYGGWYTYEKVPLGFWMQDVFGFERNNYDRIGHFVQGLFPAVLYREILITYQVVNSYAWREFIIFGFVMAFTALFELLEFGAAMAFGQGADAFLGSQGDVWDAQWDMLLCGLGGLVSIVVISKVHTKVLERNLVQ